MFSYGAGGLLLSVLAVQFSLLWAEEQYANCLTNYSVLEQAALEIGDNRYNIIKAFYSPNSSFPSVYVKVT